MNPRWMLLGCVAFVAVALVNAETAQSDPSDPGNVDPCTKNNFSLKISLLAFAHDDVIKWKHFPRYWPFVREFTGHRWIPLTKASDAEPWCFFYLLLNKCLSKQSIRRWYESPSCSLWRHRNGSWPRRRLPGKFLQHPCPKGVNKGFHLIVVFTAYLYVLLRMNPTQPFQLNLYQLNDKTSYFKSRNREIGC